MRLAPSFREQLKWSVQCEQPAVRGLVSLDGRFVDVVRYGVGAGDPIIMVPGLAGGWKLIAPLAAALSRRHEVVLYNLEGEGRCCSRLASDRVGDDAAQLEALIGELHLERPTVFGVSYGAAVALELAVERPGLLGGLVVYGGEANFEPGLGANIARRVLERYPLPPDSPFLNQFFNLLHGGVPASPELARFVVGRCWTTDQAVMAARLRALADFDVTDRLWRIEAPTLVLAGSRDVVVPPAHQQALAAAIAGARFELLEGAGHVGFLTHGASIRTHVVRHLSNRMRAAL